MPSIIYCGGGASGGIEGNKYVKRTFYVGCGTITKSSSVTVELPYTIDSTKSVVCCNPRIADATLTNTTVTVTNKNSAANKTIGVFVIEFSDLLTNLITGSISISTEGSTDTGVDATGKCLLILGGYGTSSTDTNGTHRTHKINVEIQDYTNEYDVDDMRNLTISHNDLFRYGVRATTNKYYVGWDGTKACTANYIGAYFD